MIRDFMKDKIKFIKGNGEVVGIIEAMVQMDIIYITKPIPVEEGDCFEWKNLLGVDERLRVENVSTPTNRSGEFSHIEIKYHKEKV